MKIYCLKALFSLACLLLSHSALAKVECVSLRSVLEADDDICESLSQAAETCFARLNKEFYRLEKVKKSAEKVRAINELIVDYEREIKKLNEDFFPTMSKVGGDGRACVDQYAEIEVWANEMQKDLNDLKQMK